MVEPHWFAQSAILKKAVLALVQIYSGGTELKVLIYMIYKGVAKEKQ
ncbi:hypothetical protein SAMN04487941_1314 [Pontibacter akesuensis]|uniref:Uncharacterized protein n=1 Tax=Pontibacter akesuensis TaxID=388950 RepID=A0A1I7GW83_9BACT|nr:hypothetical protein SAMN04487941_1314 [Pontibacter akesuensis]